MEYTFQIRLVQPKDTQQILDIYAPYVETSAFTFETKIPSLAIFHERIQSVMKVAPWLVCEKNNTVVGYAYAGPHRTRQAYDYTRELSVYIADGYEGKGIGTALYHSLIGLLKLQGFANTLVGITIPNPKSIIFHKKYGFKEVGTYHNVGFKLGAYHDVSWWELPIREEPAGDITKLQYIDKALIDQAIEEGNAYIKQS